MEAINEIGIEKCFIHYKIRLKSYDENIPIKCSDCVYTSSSTCSISDCSRRKEIIKSKDNPLILTRVTLTISNYGDRDWYVDNRDFYLIDSDGYNNIGGILCPQLLPAHSVEYSFRIKKNSKSDVSLFYKGFEPGVTGVCIKIKQSGKTIDFILNERYLELFPPIEESRQEEETLVQDNLLNSNQRMYGVYSSLPVRNRINNIKTDIFVRLNNVLSLAEEIKYENRINRDIYSLKLDLSSDSNNENIVYLNELKEIEDSYLSKLKSVKKEKSSFLHSLRHIDSLLDISPREFEEYIAEILPYLGYNNVSITPYVNDQGIDILAEKDGYTVAVQCKRYKGSVGSPEIQTFLGAMLNAKADKGLFITTGSFTFEATKMAHSNPIQIVDKIALAKMIECALNK